MADPNARERAALRLVEILQVDVEKSHCPDCRAKPGFRCSPSEFPGTHRARKEAAKAELHAILLQLGVGA